MVSQMRRSLGHAPRVARGAHAAAFAGESHKEVVATIFTAGAGEAMGKDAALQVFAKRLLDISRGRWRVRAKSRSSRPLCGTAVFARGGALDWPQLAYGGPDIGANAALGALGLWRVAWDSALMGVAYGTLDKYKGYPFSSSNPIIQLPD